MLTQFEEAAIDGDRTADEFGLTMREFDHHVAAPRLTCHYGSLDAVAVQRLKQRGKVTCDRRHVVAVVRLVAQPVPALVDRHNTMSPLGKCLGSTAPQQRVRSQPMHKHKGWQVGAAVPLHHPHAQPIGKRNESAVQFVMHVVSAPYASPS